MLHHIYTLSTHLREHIFPIKRHEVLKFLVLASLFFLICLNNHILRNLKETLIITKPELGINAIPFIKTWMMLPLILAFVNGYMFLSRLFSQANVTYIILSIILSYFVIFLYVLHPNENYFRLNLLGDWITANTHFNTFGEVIRHWSFALYYCMSEIWGTIVMMILFWGTCNRSADLNQAKRFYSPILFFSNLSGFASAQISIACSQGSIKHFFFPTLTNWNATLSTLTLFVCILTTIILGLFYCLNTHILETDGSIPKCIHQTEPLNNKKMSLMATIHFIATHAKFKSLAFMIFAYYFCSGILELILKYHLHMTYTDANEFNDVLNQMTIYVSLGSTFITAFVTGSLIRRFSWKLTALVTPVLLIIPLSVVVFNHCFNANNTVLATSTIAFALYFMLGLAYRKFSFFDLSKEIASVEFTNDEQIKSKSVLDGVIPKLAKTSESVFLQILMTIFIDLDPIIPFITLLIFGIHVLWIYCSPFFKKNHQIGDVV